MNLFGALPPHVLGQLLNGHNSFLIIKLWRTGDKLLQDKIERGVTHVQLNAARNSGCLFPRLLAHLRALTTLSVSSTKKLLANYHEWPSVLASLSPTLESLLLECLDSEVVLLNFHPDCTPEVPRYVSTTHPLGESSFVDLGRLFPNLTALKVNGGFPIDAKSVSGLPATLKYLNTSLSLVYTESSSYMQALPRSLTRLEGSVDMVADDEISLCLLVDDWSLAPPHLEAIERISWVGDMKNMAWLPRALLEGEINQTEIWTPTLLRTLPPNLLHFYLREVDTELFDAEAVNWCSELPKTLVSLVFNSVTLSRVALLPRTLTHLSSKTSLFHPDVDWSAITVDFEQHKATGTDFEFWPPSLTNLYLFNVTIAPHQLRLLPSTLTKLKITVTQSETHQMVIDGQALPPKLTQLRLGFLLAPNTPPTKILNNLPTTLTRLSIRDPISRESYEAIPNSVTDLSLTTTLEDVQSANDAVRLPPNLTRLKVARWRTQWFSSLPRMSLENLEMTYLSGIRSSLINKGDGKTPDDTLFEGLPASLKRLKIAYRELDEMTAGRNLFTQLVSQYMPSLTYLDLGILGFFPGAMVAHLPRALTSVTMVLLGLSEDEARSLPPMLTRARLQPTYGSTIPWTQPYVAELWPVRAVMDIPSDSAAQRAVRFAVEKRRISELCE